jgi:hypothetical protein
MVEGYRLGEPYQRPRRKGLKVVVLLCTLMAITILPALAAKSGGGATLTFSSSAGFSATGATQVAVGSQYYVKASGFRPNVWVAVGAHFSTTYWGSGVTDSNGNVTIGPFTADSCGQIAHEGDQLNEHNGRMSQKASATLDVSC